MPLGKRTKVLILIAILGVGFFSQFQQAFGADNQNVEGQVGITLTEDYIPPVEPPTKPDPPKPDPPRPPDPITKPGVTPPLSKKVPELAKKFLPKTNEEKSRMLIIFGVIMVVSVVIYYVKKEKRRIRK